MLPKPITSFISYLYRKAKGLEAHVDKIPWSDCVVGGRLENMVDSLRVYSSQIPVGVVLLEAQHNLQWSVEMFNRFSMESTPSTSGLHMF